MFGDYSTAFSLFGNSLNYGVMPTAIVRLYTPEGWVIAADGRKRNSETGETWDDTQKIFPVIQRGRSLVYGIAGDAGISDHTHKNIAFSSHAEAAKAIDSLPKDDAPDLMTFSERVAKRIYDSLGEAQKQNYIVPFREGEQFIEPSLSGFTIATVFWAGFYRGAPSAVKRA